MKMKFNMRSAIFGFCLSFGVVLFVAAIACLANGNWPTAVALALLICLDAFLLCGIDDCEDDEEEEDDED